MKMVFSLSKLHISLPSYAEKYPLIFFFGNNLSRVYSNQDHDESLLRFEEFHTCRDWFSRYVLQQVKTKFQVHAPDKTRVMFI